MKISKQLANKWNKENYNIKYKQLSKCYPLNGQKIYDQMLKLTCEQKIGTEEMTCLLEH